MTCRRGAVLIGVAIAALWLSTGAFLCDSVLRVQHKPVHSVRTEGPPHTAEITADDGVVLRAAFIPVNGARDCVVILHGIADSRTGSLGFAPMFVDAGYSVLAPDSRGHGASGGDLVTFGLLESADVLRWASWLRKQGCQRLFGLGESLGASILIQAAAREPVFAAIVAECAFRDFPSVAEYRIAQSINGPALLSRALATSIVSAGLLYAYARYGLNLKAASPIEHAKRLSTPLLLIHGLEDWNTPPSHSRAIEEAAPRAVVWFVPGAGHIGASAHDPAGFRRRVLTWFRHPGTLPS